MITIIKSHLTITSTIFVPNTPSLTTLVTFIQTPENLITLNPLIQSFHQPDPDNPNLYAITDRIPLACGISTPSTYTAEFSRPEEVQGMLCTSRAEMGVVTGSFFWVEDSIGGIMVKERFKIYRAPFGIKWFVMMVAGKSRKGMMERLEGRLISLCKEQDSPRGRES